MWGGKGGGKVGRPKLYIKLKEFIWGRVCAVRKTLQSDNTIFNVQ